MSAAFTLALLLGLLPPAAEAASHDIVVFCRAQKDLDQPGPAYFGKAYRRGMLPDQVEEAGATDWRRMDGKVFLCLNSADGSACTRKDGSRMPRPLLHEICRNDPGLDYVPTDAAGYSSSTWRARG